MEWLAFLLIVASAMLHASWNLIAKKSTMTFPFYAVLCTFGVFAWLHVQFWTPVRIFSQPRLFWVMLFASVWFDIVYCWGLIHVYRKMEISTAYPVMRSLPIIFTTFFTALLGWGKPIAPTALVGFTLVFFGAFLMPMHGFRDIKLANYCNKGMFFILFAALGTTGYTIFDSQAQQILRQSASAAEVSKPVISLTYYSTRSICLSSTLWLITFLIPATRRQAAAYWHDRNIYPVIAGCCASSTYVLVLIAMNYVSNVSYVQVFRQLGLPLGMVGGVLFLKEKCPVVRVVGLTLILGGLALSLYH